MWDGYLYIEGERKSPGAAARLMEEPGSTESENRREDRSPKGWLVAGEASVPAEKPWGGVGGARHRTGLARLYHTPSVSPSRLCP